MLKLLLLPTFAPGSFSLSQFYTTLKNRSFSPLIIPFMRSLILGWKKPEIIKVKAKYLYGFLKHSFSLIFETFTLTIFFVSGPGGASYSTRGNLFFQFLGSCPKGTNDHRSHTYGRFSPPSPSLSPPASRLQTQPQGPNISLKVPILALRLRF